MENNITFEEFINSKSTVIVDFYADWCGPCKALVPILKELPEGTVQSINVESEEGADLASEYRIQALPTLVYFREGKEIKRTIGFQTLKQIQNEL
jgi:thioredoxin 1